MSGQLCKVQLTSDRGIVTSKRMDGTDLRNAGRSRKNLSHLPVILLAAFLACPVSHRAVLAQNSRSVLKNSASKPTSTRTVPVKPANEPDCPLLPGCPDGPPVPLPPDLKASLRPKTTAPVIDRKGIREGSGEFAGMVLIPAGPFPMGSPDSQGRPDERPPHQAFLKDFYISQKEVTVREYCNFLNSRGLLGKNRVPRVNLSIPDCPVVRDGRKFKPREGMAFRPMTCVSWYGAQDYARWRHARLPTAAEWEKAALLTNPNPPGDFLTILPRKSSVPVSISTPGIKGVSGMIGNVWEWCSDWYDRDYYASSSRTNPKGPSLGKHKEIRGGSWASAEASRRIRNRHSAPPQGYFKSVGFRIVKDLGVASK